MAGERPNSDRYTWTSIPGTERFRAHCNEHGAMSWRLVNHKDYPDSRITKVRGLVVDVKGQLTQIWRCTSTGCTVETVC